VCGHLHEGRGAERIWWRDDVPGCPDMEERVEYWVDPGAGVGNRKQSLLDLTAKARGEWSGDPAVLPKTRTAASQQCRKAKGHVSFAGTEKAGSPSAEEILHLKDVDSYQKSLAAHTIHRQSKKVAVLRDLATRSAVDDGGERMDERLYLPTEDVDIDDGSIANPKTCVVNAAIMANSWGGPKRLNKPIVVDIDLPVWTGEA
jgi:hypothetical protein